LNEIEIAPHSVVWQAASDFANALSKTAQFESFEQADFRLRKDDRAQKALLTYQSKWRSLEALIRLNALSSDDQLELERLRQAYITEPSVVAFIQAQANLVELCQTAGNMFSQATGLNFSSVCGSGCCG
jgi:cell fate (sporulation/competence/biofilm development) regulator YlbF (YheA/YmcA/DUF963 family)